MEKEYYIVYDREIKFPIPKGYKLLYTVWYGDCPSYTIFKKVISDDEYIKYDRMAKFLGGRTRSHLRILDSAGLTNEISEVMAYPKTLHEFVSHVKIRNNLAADKK